MERNSDRFATVDKSLVNGFEPDRVEPDRVLQAEQRHGCKQRHEHEVQADFALSR